MADRQDPSQFVFTGGPADGIAALPLTDIVNDQLQPRAEGDYAEAGEMLELTPAPFADDFDDLLHEHPGRFYTQGPARTRDIGKPRPVVAGYLIAGDGLLAGLNVRETTGTGTAVVKLRDGADSGAPLISVTSLAANESARDWYVPGALKYRFGLYVEITGTVEGVLYTLETEDVI